MKKVKISSKSSRTNDNKESNSFLNRANSPRPSMRKSARRRRSSLSYVDEMDIALTAEERNDLGV